MDEMDDSPDPRGSPRNVKTPLSKAEWIEQLADVDNDISLLLTHMGTGIQSLAQPVHATSSGEQAPSYGILNLTNPEDTIANLDSEERLATFKASMGAFLTTLQSVDACLKRQIWGLEEAGVITLGGPKEAATDGAEAEGAAKRTLQPDGVGKVGGLDVGWLNARSNKVEREMESELWTKMRKHLEDVVEGRMQVGGELFQSVKVAETGAEKEAEDTKMGT